MALEHCSELVRPFPVKPSTEGDLLGHYEHVRALPNSLKQPKNFSVQSVANRNLYNVLHLAMQSYCTAWNLVRTCLETPSSQGAMMCHSGLGKAPPSDLKQLRNIDVPIGVS